MDWLMGRKDDIRYPNHHIPGADDVWYLHPGDSINHLLSIKPWAKTQLYSDQHEK
jgi:hypothetical protein